VKKSSGIECHGQFKEGRDGQDDPRIGQPKMRGTEANVARERTLVHSDRRFDVRLIAELDMGICCLTTGFSAMTMLLRMMHQELTSS
jgi:hypothetical protein